MELNRVESAGRQWSLFVLLLAVVWLNCPCLVQAATDPGFLSFQSKCNCSLTMACTCCQTAVVNPMNLTKTACVTFKINLLKASVDITVSVDGTSVNSFTLDTKTPTSFCLPVISDMTPLALCIKMSTKMSGLTNLNICPNFYSNFNTNQIMAYDLPCIKLGLDGFSIV